MCSTTEKDKNLHFFLQSHNKCDKIILAVGPEGGFDNDEEEQFVKNGFAKVSLGKRIMRVETVPIFLLSILNYLVKLVRMTLYILEYRYVQIS